MKTKAEIEYFHKQNEEKYLGKNTDKGVIEKIEYLTFVGATGGNYHSRPHLGERGLVVGTIGKKSYPIGELKFLPMPIKEPWPEDIKRISYCSHTNLTKF